MARKVFFSFHYKRDVLKIGQIRNSWLTKGEAQKFLDAAEWESIKKQGDVAIKRWIDNQMHGTSVTIVLIGAETANRPYVKYEIQKSHSRGNGMLGIYLYGMKDLHGNVDNIRGQNPFSQFGYHYPIYNWVSDNGYENLATWIESAAKIAGR
jgi:hypothetical protein